jgi:hypothetical protein
VAGANPVPVFEPTLGRQTESLLFMTRHKTFSTFILAAALACGPALAIGQQNNDTKRDTNTAGQDMRNAGHDTKNAAKNAGHATKKGAKKAYHKTKRGTKKAYNKTKNTTKGAIEGGKEGAHEPQ